MVKTIIGKVVGSDGVGLEYTWSGTRLGIKREDDENYTFVDLVGPSGPQGDDPYVIRFAQVTDSTTGEEKVEVQYYDPDNLSEPVQTEDFVITGKQGDTGKYYYPSVDSSGNLTWTMYPASSVQSLPSSVNIKGPKGDIGDPASGVALENFLWFEVDNEGDLYVMGYDGVEADFEYDDDPTSDTYGGLFRVYDEDTKIFLGNVKGPIGTVSDNVLNRISTLESNVSTLQSTVSSLQSTITSLTTRISQLESTVETLNNTISLIEEEEEAQNILLGND